jgi:serine/threonine protein kinase/tetratricopeptide (TPR) repeat protein
MSPKDSPVLVPPQLPSGISHDTLVARADLMCEFEDSLRSSQPATLAQFVAMHRGMSVDDLIELVMIDQRVQWGSGIRILVEDYLAQFPELCSDNDNLITLLGYEYELCQLHGEKARPEQYYDRFPALRSLLREHFCLCQALVGTSAHELGEMPPPPPRVPPKFRLVVVHAEGGLGRVWRAYDSELNREVALKELRPQLAGRSLLRARFLREAQVTGQLEHPNIVPVYELVDAGADTQPCYAMRFVRGQTLSEAVCDQFDARLEKPDSMSRLRLLNVFISVCNAIAYAHSRGIVHRDLKPENIVLGRFGEVFVADWGLAKITGSTDEHSATIPSGQSALENTVAGSVMGTLAYMAPEQAAGDGEQIDARTDIYGLGAILYVLLTGKPPRQGSSRSELLDRASNDEPVRPRLINRTVPLALEAICVKAMARLPEQRYGSATEVAQEVQRWMVDQPVEAYREPLLPRIRRWTSHYRPIVFLGSFVALAFIVVTLVARPDRATLEKLRLIQARQDSADRFTQFEALSADAYFYGLPGATGDIARAERSCDEALALYAVQSADQCATASDPDLNATLSAELPLQLARLFTLRSHLRAQSGGDERGSTSDLDRVRTEEFGNSSRTLSEYFRGEEFRLRDDLEEAIRCYQRVLVAEPQNYWALRGLGFCYLRTGQADLARLAYQSCITLQPRSPWPWMQRGVAAALAEDAEQARSDFMHALEIAPDFQPARFNLGLLFASRGDHQLAIEQFDACLQKTIDPDVLNARSKSRIALGDLLSALDDAESALRSRPAFGPALVSQARIKVRRATENDAASLSSALDDLNTALKHSPNLVEAHVERAMVVELMGDIAGALESLGHALRIVRFDATILRERARLLEASGKHEQAVRDYSVLVRAGKASSHDRRRMGKCHAELKLWRDAIDDFTEVLTLEPGDLATRLCRAACLAAMGDLAAAESDCEQVLQASPGDPAADRLKSRIEDMKSDEVNRAGREFQRAIDAPHAIEPSTPN